MSGSASFLGAPEEQGLRMIVEQWNNAGAIEGHRFKVTVYDAEEHSVEAVQQLRRLVESDNFHVIFGPSTSGESLAAIPISNELKAR